MINLNLGITSFNRVRPSNAYGTLRSSNLIIDSLCLAIQGLAIGSLFGKPLVGCAVGAIASYTDRLYFPYINRHISGNSYTACGLPLGLKNITLCATSILSSFAIVKIARTLVR